MSDFIGFHTQVTSDNLPDRDNLQMFMLPPDVMFDKTVNERIPIYKQAITKWKCAKATRKMFVHGSYCINLCNPQMASLNATKNQLRFANEIGADGLVIHCGKSLKMAKSDAIKLFMDNVGNAIERATEKCPLIIETCVGAGTELFSKLEDFEQMILTLVMSYGKKIGCCIDTAHVFSAGYNPKDFINRLSNQMRGTIRLIHWNNSKSTKGSHVDRHASLHEGLIDPKELIEVASWAIHFNIPLVIE